MSEGATAPVPEGRVRASDVERQQVADVVRLAAGDGRLTMVEADERLGTIYAARYRDELRPVTADLTTEDPLAPVGGATPTVRTSAPVPAEDVTALSIALMSGVNRRGPWAPGPRHRAVAVMGGVELRFDQARLDPTGLTVDAVVFMGGMTVDLRGAALGAHGVSVHAVAIMGGVEVIVDEETRVDARGLGLMGGFDNQAGRAGPPDPSGPLVRIRGAAVMGGVTVHRRPPRVPRERDADRALDAGPHDAAS